MSKKSIVEQKLNNLILTKESIKLLPTILDQNTKEVDILNKALSQLTNQERKIIELTCIQNKSPYELEEQLKMTTRNIYNQKKSALSKLEKIYGIEG